MCGARPFECRTNTAFDTFAAARNCFYHPHLIGWSCAFADSLDHREKKEPFLSLEKGIGVNYAGWVDRLDRIRNAFQKRTRIQTVEFSPFSGVERSLESVYPTDMAQRIAEYRTLRAAWDPASFIGSGLPKMVLYAFRRIRAVDGNRTESADSRTGNMGCR